MVGTANIVSWNDRDKGSSTILTGGLDSTKSIGLDGSSRAVTVALGLYAGVNPGSVGAP